MTGILRLSTRPPLRIYCWTPLLLTSKLRLSGRPAAIGKTEAIVRAVDAGVVEGEVDEVLVDAIEDVVNGSAGVGGASKRMNNVKLTTSELKSDATLPLLIVSTR